MCRVLRQERNGVVGVGELDRGVDVSRGVGAVQGFVVGRHGPPLRSPEVRGGTGVALGGQRSASRPAHEGWKRRPNGAGVLGGGVIGRWSIQVRAQETRRLAAVSTGGWVITSDVRRPEKVEVSGLVEGLSCGCGVR